MRDDIEKYKKFTETCTPIFEEMDEEIFGNQTSRAIEGIETRGLLTKFNKIKVESSWQPLYDEST